MRIPMPTLIAFAALTAACQPAGFDHDDPTIVAAIDSIVADAMEGAREVDADRVLAMAEGDGELTFITGDVMVSGLELLRESSRATYAGLESQGMDLIEKRVRVLSPDVAVVLAISEGDYTDKDGWTSEPIRIGHTIIFVRENGQWRARHAHQSFTP